MATIEDGCLRGDECVICLEPMNVETTRLMCGHELHTHCLQLLFNESGPETGVRLCPVCRKLIGMVHHTPGPGETNPRTGSTNRNTCITNSRVSLWTIYFLMMLGGFIYVQFMYEKVKTMEES